MKQIRLAQPHHIDVVDRDDPIAEPDEVLVELTSWGVCSGDLAAWAGRNHAVAYPLTLGHEAGGVVVGAPVDSGFSEGDSVIVIPSVTCGECEACLAGRQNHCRSLVVKGVKDPNGVFAERIAVPARQLVRLPGQATQAHGALVEPVAIAVHIAGRAPALGGTNILVIGSGVTGLLTAAVARARGAAAILLADVAEQRRKVAAALGFTDFTLAEGANLVEDAERRLGTVDVVFDSVGTSETMAAATAVLRPGGTVVGIAAPRPKIVFAVDHAAMYSKELSFVLSRNYTPSDFHAAIDLIEAGEVDARPLVTDRFPLDRADEALRALEEHPADHLKIQLEAPAR